MLYRPLLYAGEEERAMPSVIFFILGVAVVLGVAAFMLSLVVTYLRQVHEAPPLRQTKTATGSSPKTQRNNRICTAA